MLRLVIYDLDGTLVDTKQDIAEAVNFMLARLGEPPLEAQDICRYVGHGLHHLIAHCLRTQEARRIEAGTALYRTYYATHLLDHSRLYPGVIDTLRYCQRHHQAVLTNKPNPYSRELLIGLGIAEYFVEIIAGDSGYPKKPDPAAAHALMARTQASAQETLMVGDSPIDIETGQRAGVRTVGVAQGFVDRAELAAAKPDVLVSDFSELLAWVRHDEA